MNFTTDVIIGLEIHIQLDTRTKLFSASPTAKKKDTANSRCDVINLGMPGTKPRLNKEAIHKALKLCLATNCEIAPELVFSRKSYFYPDLSKNYQTTQYEMPLGEKGFITLMSGKKVNLTRIHVEEDPASLTHPSGMDASKFVLIDYNRSGNPLCELVTEPEMYSPEEARDFLKQLIAILSYLKIFDNQNGIIKADANVSIKEKDYTRVEIKNITGFKELERALNYEIERQKTEDVVLETRGWDADQGITRSLRKKESEEEYGYILDPDIPVTEITQEMKDACDIPEMPYQKALRLIDEYKLTEEDAHIIAQSQALAHVFEKAIQTVSASTAVTWMRHELNRVLNYNKLELEDIELNEEQMLVLMQMVEKKELTENSAKKVLNKLVVEPIDVKAFVEKEGLKAVSDKGALEGFCRAAIDANPKVVEDYKSGNEKALNFLLGQVMRQTKGAASPPELLEIIKSLI